MLSTSPSLYGRGTISTSRCGSQACASMLIVALNRPGAKNAFSDEMYLDLVEVLEEVSADSSLAALILTGSGSYFSSGADLKQVSILSEDGSERNTLDSPAGRFMMAVIEFPKILCAAVNGPAIGIAVTLLLHCDLCYSSDKATFWAPFTRLALGTKCCVCFLCLSIHKCQQLENGFVSISNLQPEFNPSLTRNPLFA